MDTKILKDDEEGIIEAGETVSKGGIVAFPTETVYGLGASAFCDEAVKKIFKAKGRPSDNPLIVHIADKTDIYSLAADISERAQKLIDAFMPGPFTIILKKNDAVCDTVTAGMDTVGIRFPENETAVRFIRAAGLPIAAPSANLSGKPSPTTAKHVKEDMTGRIDAIIDGGDCSVGVESTIVDASKDVPVLLRPGGITFDMLCSVVPEMRVDPNLLHSIGENERPLCPGMKYKHYAPNAEVTVIEGKEDAVKRKIDELLSENSGRLCGVMTMSDNAYDSAVILCAGRTNREYAKNLFGCLREFDRLGVEVVFAEFEERDGYGLAVKNRLYKAAAQRVIRV